MGASLEKFRITTIIVGVTLLIGSLATLWGLLHMKWDRYPHIPFVCVILLFVWLGSQISRKSPLHIGIFYAILIAIATGNLWPLIVAFWIASAFTIFGRCLVNKLPIASNEWLLSVLVGAGVYGTGVGLIAHFPVSYPGVYATALILPLVVGRTTLQQLVSLAKQKLVQPYHPDDSASLWLDISIVTVLLVYFVTALMPELGHDALVTHLFVPAHLATKQQWSFDVTTYVWAVMPMLGDWIFSIGYMLANETAARLINTSFIFFLSLLVSEIVQWAGGSITGARWAVLIFLSTPLTFTESSSLFIEAVWASFIVAGLLSVLKACSSDKHHEYQFLIAGVLLGFALAAKAITFTVLPVFLLFLIWRYKNWLELSTPKSLLHGFVLLLAFGCVPYVTAWWFTGNPVFPFFNKIFQSPLWLPVNFEAPAVFGKGLTWDFIYRVTFQSDKYLEAKAGAGGFQWLLLLFPLGTALILGWYRRGISLILFGILSTALVFHWTAYLRYIFPAFTVMTAAIGVGLSLIIGLGTVQARMISCVAAIVVALNIILLLNGNPFYTDFPLKSILSKEHRERYLADHLPIRNAVSVVNSLNTERTPVAVFASPQTAGLNSDVLYANWYNVDWQTRVAKVKTEQDIVGLLQEKRVDFLIVDSSWQMLKEQRSLIEQVSMKIDQIGTVAVRRLKDDYLFTSELMTNPDFVDIKGWSLIKNAVYNGDTKSVIVSVNSPGVQTVAVTAGQRYLNTVIARCHKEKTQGRIQVNWCDTRGFLIRPDILVFDCESDWHQLSMEVKAPPNTVNATVYASGHTTSPVEFKKVSFKQ